MTGTLKSDITAVMRWRFRMLRNMLRTDLGFLTLAVGAVVYSAILVLVASQAWYGATIAALLRDRSPELGIRVCGMYFVLLCGIQAASVLFIRMTLYGDLRSAVWRTLPISERALRYARWIDSLINPGVVASLLAAWLLLFGFVKPTGIMSTIACILTAPAFVILTQSVVLLAVELLESFRTSVWWTVPVGVALIGAPIVLYLDSIRDASGVVGLLMSRAAQTLLALPPWSPAVMAIRALHHSMPGIALVVALAATVASGCILAVAARVPSVEPE